MVGSHRIARPAWARLAPGIRVVAFAAVLLAAATGLAAPAVADQASSMTIGDVTVDEGDSGTTPAVFTLTLTQPSRTRTTVSYSTANQSARSPSDYTATSGQVVFAPGVTTRTVSVDVIGDTRYEGDETFELQVGSSDTRVPNSFGTATIVDDDARPYVSVGDASAVEGNSGTTPMVFPVTLDRPAGSDVRVHYQTDTGTANLDDFQYSSGTVTIPAGHTSASVTVQVIGDAIDEGISQYFFVELTSPVGAVVYGTNGRGTIVDDDSTPVVSLQGGAVVEGNSGTTTLPFTFTLSPPSLNPVTAFYATADSGATSADYTPLQGSVVFAPGQTSKTVGVAVKGDTVYEGSGETVRMYFNRVLGASPAESGANGTIVDDDSPPSGSTPPPASAYHLLSVADAVVVEPDTGTVNEVFTVSLQPKSSSQATVTYTTADGSATAPADYTTTSGTLTFPANATSATVKVPVRGDDYQEDDERFTLHLANPVGASIAANDASGYILNDDAAPSVSAADTSVQEGDPGSTRVASVEITLSAPSLAPSTVTWSTQDSNASSPSDYLAASGTVTFQPGETTHTVQIAIVGDTMDESNEEFYVNLSAAGNVVADDYRSWVEILDDDRNPGLAVDDASTYEGTGSTAQAVFTITMSAPSANTVTVNAFTTDGSATAPADYTAVNTTVTFAPGQTVQTVAVTVQGDDIDENDEYLNLRLASPVNAYLTDALGYLDVMDDDTLPSVSIGEGALVEPATGTAPMTFPVTLSAASLEPVTVGWSTTDRSAVSPADYQAASGTVTFNPGQTTRTITVNIAGDGISEGYEYFGLSLSSPTNATLRDSFTYGGIYDVDPMPQLSVQSTGLVEGNSGSKTANVTVTLAPASPTTVTVGYFTSDNSAVVGSDYTATSGTLTFAPGTTTLTVPVQVLGDTTHEGDENFLLRLADPVHAHLLTSTGYVVILDDDQNPAPGSAPPDKAPVVSASNAAVVEGNGGTTNAVFQVQVAPAPTSPVTVDYYTTDESATAGVDYTAVAGTLTFAAGQTSKAVTVPVTPDQYVESDEEFDFRLADISSGAQYGTATGTGHIIDDDHTPLISIGDTTVDEGGAGRTVDAAFTVRLLQPAPLPVLVDWATRDGSALAPYDYQDAGGTVRFEPGETTKTVHVTVNGDDEIEGDEYFDVDLYGAAGGGITSTEGTGVGTILDSDTFDVLGSVTNAGGTAVSGASITVSGNAKPSRTVVTGTTGNYEFDDLPDGRYTLTPSLAGKIFTPATATVDVRGGAVTGQTFLATAKPTIGGRVTDATGLPVPGVTVTRKGNSQSAVTATTNGAGYYVFAGSPAGTYTIVPSAPGSTFSPAQRSVTQTASNSVSADFTRA